MTRLLFVISLMMLANYELSFASVLRHNIREMATYDVEDMERLVNKEINIKEKNDEAFFTQATRVLSQTVLVQPRFAEREAGLARLKGKMLQEEFFEVMKRSADVLITLLEDKNSSAADQASAAVALTNLVIEARRSSKDEMKSTLEKIAKAEIEISDEARAYGREPLKDLISPSEEAKVSLEK